MPFDPMPVDADEDLSFATGDTGLLRLAKLLDREQEWRDKTMGWDFNTILDRNSGGCGTAGCAMGLACMSWPEYHRIEVTSLDAECIVFGLSEDEADNLFFPTGYDIPVEEIQPHHVSKAIRDFVFKRSGMV